MTGAGRTARAAREREHELREAVEGHLDLLDATE